MGETNIADAISTFSEIGIVAGLAWLLEVLPMQKDLEASLLIAIESQQVTQAHYREKAKEFGRLTELALCLWLFIEYYSFKLLIILLYRIQRAFPFVCVVLGVWSLCGIAFYPTLPSSPPLVGRFISFDREKLDIVYFCMSIISSMSVFTTFFTRQLKDLINWYALKDVKIE